MKSFMANPSNIERVIIIVEHNAVAIAFPFGAEACVKASSASCEAITVISGGSMLFMARFKLAAGMPQPVVKETTCPLACTPLSVLPEPASTTFRL